VFRNRVNSGEGFSVISVGENSKNCEPLVVIVQCSPYSAKDDCHINVECAATVKSIKHSFKYIHKGSDHATLEIDGDEIKPYIDGRYIGSPEAAWRIFHFDPHT
jgi:hypothetical protein